MNVFSLKVSIDDGAIMSAEGVESTNKYFDEMFNGQCHTSNWHPPLFHFSEDEGIPENDFASCLSWAAFIVSSKAACELKKIVNKGFELLEVKVAGRQDSYYILNVCCVADCLDLSRTELLFADDEPNKLLLMTQPHFVESKVPPTSAFKVPQDTRRIFVTMPFVEVVTQHRLTGVYFEDPREESFAARFPLFGTPF
jgi:hypothetical protein